MKEEEIVFKRERETGQKKRSHLPAIIIIWEDAAGLESKCEHHHYK